MWEGLSKEQKNPLVERMTTLLDNANENGVKKVKVSVSEGNRKNKYVEEAAVSCAMLGGTDYIMSPQTSISGVVDYFHC